MVNLDKVLQTAIDRDASDVHLIAGIKPMLRIARALVPYEFCEELTKEDMAEIYDYFVMGNVEKDAVYKEQKQLDTSYEFNGLRLRVNIAEADGMPIVTLRIIKNNLPTFEQLGVPDIVRRMMYQPQGLILVTGKTNSGKSTTLNALINEINESQNKKILTLESPVEFKHHCKRSIIVQKEVGRGQDVTTYQAGVKNSLREDCDILVIGEIRDRETMDAAIETAESGHLVIGTLHTKSCAETIDRIINFYDISDQQSIKFLIASLLKLVTSQRLIRGKNDKLVLIPEVMVVDNVISGIIRKEKFSVSEVEDAIQDNTRAIYLETLGNPNSDIPDIDAIAEIAHKHGLPLVIDNTFGTPYLIRPIEHGADIVVHSATKFIGGHGTTLGGIIVDSGKFDWKASGKYPAIADANPSYHGVSFVDAAGPAAFVTYIRAILLRDMGATISPFNAFLLLQGTETLSLRIDRHVENTKKVVEYLSNHPMVEHVNHPSLSNHPDHALYEKYFPNGGASIFTFEIKGGQEEAHKFIDNLKIFSLLANVADVKSLVIHPATTTHSQLTEEELLDQGIKPNTIRLSIGTEHIDDIIADLEGGFAAVQGK